MKKWLVCILLVFAGNVWADESLPPMRLALSAVFLGERQDVVTRWQKYLEAHLQRPVTFVQRRSYRELTDLLRNDQLDAAWVCSAPYVLHKPLQRLMAVGVWQGEPLYQSYLIVPKRDTATRSIADLRGKNFAYSDPESNSGHFVALGEIARLNADPETFFAKTFYTYSHRKSVVAVADGLADGARVDGYIYDMLNTLYPNLIAQTRVVQKSDKFGFPPIVARANLPEGEYQKLRKVLLGMQNDTEGKALLAALGLDKFSAGDERLFDKVAALIQEVQTAETRRAKKP